MIVCLDKLESSLGISRRELGGAQSRLPYVDRLYGHSSPAAAAH